MCCRAVGEPCCRVLMAIRKRIFNDVFRQRRQTEGRPQGLAAANMASAILATGQAPTAIFGTPRTRRIKCPEPSTHARKRHCSAQLFIASARHHTGYDFDSWPNGSRPRGIGNRVHIAPRMDGLRDRSLSRATRLGTSGSARTANANAPLPKTIDEPDRPIGVAHHGRIVEAETSRVVRASSTRDGNGEPSNCAR